jgi:hypothetical protein
MKDQIKKGVLFAVIIIVLVGGVFLEMFFSKKNSAPSTNNKPVGYSYQTLGLNINSPLKLVLSDAGVNTIKLTPEDDKYKEKVYAIVAEISSETVKKMNGASLLQNAKGIYMGATKPATEKVERRISNTKITGELQKTTIPKPSTLESYLVQNSTGKTFFVGIKYQTTKEEIDSFVDSLLASIQK